METSPLKNAESHYSLLASRSRSYKFNTERLHKLINEVHFRYKRLSPSNCSKNVLAASSNIEAELENARLCILTPTIINYKENHSLSPSKMRARLPSITNSPSKKLRIKPRINKEDLKLQATKFSEWPLVQEQTSRLRRIDKIIKNCRGLEKELSSESQISQRKLKSNISDYKDAVKVIEGKSLEQGLLDRCLEHGRSQNEDKTGVIKLADALKRGKKMWKQNHIAFMKSIDKLVYSIPTMKK